MAKDRTNAGPGDTVELADKETGFFDSSTQFKIVRDQRVKLGDTIGAKTLRALSSGSLLLVSGKSKSKAAETDPPEGDEFDLPADLPGREAFIAAGFTTFASVKELDTEEKLLAIKGIGTGTVKNLAAWAEANPPKE